MRLDQALQQARPNNKDMREAVHSPTGIRVNMARYGGICLWVPDQRVGYPYHAGYVFPSLGKARQTMKMPKEHHYAVLTLRLRCGWEAKHLDMPQRERNEWDATT